MDHSCVPCPVIVDHPDQSLWLTNVSELSTDRNLQARRKGTCTEECKGKLLVAYYRRVDAFANERQYGTVEADVMALTKTFCLEIPFLPCCNRAPRMQCLVQNPLHTSLRRPPSVHSNTLCVCVCVLVEPPTEIRAYAQPYRANI